MLHTRFLKLGNEAGAIEILGATVLTEGAGAHPLFNGVRTVTVTGLPGEPALTEVNGRVLLRADGVNGELAGAAVDRAGRTITIRLGALR